MGDFPKRYQTIRNPDYPDVVLDVLLNPTGTLYNDLIDGNSVDKREMLGAALVAAYKGGKIEAYGESIDMSTADAALATLENESLPIDLRWWLRNAPLEIVDLERSEMGKKLAESLMNGRTPHNSQ